MSDPVRVTVFFSGDVQGVGFRATAASLAREFPVTGWVRNLPDGRVELVAEGPRPAVESFLATVESAMSKQIHARECSWGRAAGGLTGFSIAR